MTMFNMHRNRVGYKKITFIIGAELYWKQSATIRIEGNFGRSIRALKSARQGCVTPPNFF